MDILAKTIKILQNKGWYEEFKTEINEVLDNIDITVQEQLFKLLTSDKVTKKQLKELFQSSISTSSKYKISHILK